MSQPSSVDYPAMRKALQQQIPKLAAGQSEVMKGFSGLHRAAVADGALSTKTKELIALAIAVSARCDGCIAFHTHDALKAGATREEVMDALGVAILMGGGPSMVPPMAGELSSRVKQHSASVTGVVTVSSSRTANNLRSRITLGERNWPIKLSSLKF